MRLLPHAVIGPTSVEGRIQPFLPPGTFGAFGRIGHDMGPLTPFRPNTPQRSTLARLNRQPAAQLGRRLPGFLRLRSSFFGLLPGRLDFTRRSAKRHLFSLQLPPNITERTVSSKAQRRLSPRETTCGRNRKASPQHFQSDTKLIELDALVAGLALG
jgi:hypothetical protein